ncbi:MAG: zinc ribbon domain-containing protein [Proteobacteria bacterium]|nr:zinc ribbon domain-containing protein [Pseudomonadota bacterium]
MPYYDFECPDCGPFTELRPMALAAEPCECPACGSAAPRGYFTPPTVLGMDTNTKKAFAINEESRHAPKLSSKSDKYRLKHGANCSCCSGKSKNGKTLYRADGAKAFPASRPWMISH